MIGARLHSTKPVLVEAPIRVLHIATSIGRNSFGPGQVAVNLAKAQNDLIADSQIWCLDTDDQIDWAITLPGLERSRVTAFPCLGPSRLGFSLAMLSAAQSDDVDFNIVHQHGIWTACSQASSALRKTHNVSTVIAPHGSLQKWALRRSPWKKRLALLAYERENLHRAACIHATAEAEVADFRNYGLSNPIAVIPNGVSETWLESQGDGIRFREQHAIPADRHVLFFLSRITPKKGLPLLLEAINRVRSSFADWLLVVAGTDEFGHLQEVESLVSRLNLWDLVKFTGPLFDQNKRDAFAASDVFVLPSYSEGAPMVVLDSLATGVPVMTTTGTSWRSLVEWNAGWWVDASVEGIVQALHDILSLSGSQLDAMGRNGRDLVRSHYLWKVQAQKTLDLYTWLLGWQTKPDFVITD
jgi:glycosyltransferase involved in cell wall biosynthesis